MIIKLIIKFLIIILLTSKPSFSNKYIVEKITVNDNNFPAEINNKSFIGEKGDKTAQFNLGLTYHYGYGVQQDYAEAFKWYSLAADQGLASAQNNLGLMYYLGDGIAKDYNEAYKWYILAAEQGFASAQFNLGLMYNNGDGIPKNNIDAYMWFKLASSNGDNDAKIEINKLNKVLSESELQKALKLYDNSLK